MSCSSCVVPSPSIELAPLAPAGCEHVPLAIYARSSDAALAVAAEIAALIRRRRDEGRPVVLGLATGSTPLGVYAELRRLHREEGLSFAHVITFNLDEYHPLQPTHPESYHSYMRTQLFDHVDVRPENIHVPSGNVRAGDIDEHCRSYEREIREAGGIDFQLLGIGRTGHIGFNEPGSAARSGTRWVTLDPITRRDAAGAFGGCEHTPRHAITMGIRTILEARRVVVMAWGRHKSAIVRAAVEGEPTARVPASYLQDHDDALFVLDEAAAGALTRRRTPWLARAPEDQGLAWDEPMTRRAILWLSRRTGKAILKLTDADYNDAGLQDLLRVHGSAYEANRAGFYQMQHTITGWPGGRDPHCSQPGDAPVRPLRSRSAGVFPKRVLVLSPHPDDDVISMGGTLCRLAGQGHEVHVAYQVSGHTAVSDETVWRTLLFARDSGLVGGGREGAVAAWIAEFERSGQLEPTTEVRRFKGMMRRHEAGAAARVCGVPLARLHFLDLPFYDADAAGRRRLGAADVTIMHRLLADLQPHLIFAAGDLDDPHGTHLLCLQAVREAIAAAAAERWRDEAEVWLYRGAWAEWDLDEIDLAVPLSPDEVLRRRQAIFRHETQKDQALFLGDDGREFWQRTEDRSRHLAEAYNALGLAEYEAIEAFRRYSPAELLRYVQV